MRKMMVVAAGGLLMGCQGSDPVGLETPAEEEALDVRVTDEDVGGLEADQFALEGAERVIQPGEDIMFCVYGTYEGPTVGLHDVHTYQGKFGHHFQLMGTTTPLLDVADGTVIDCTDGGGYAMADIEPLGLANRATVDGHESDLSLALPDGMAVELESGQRYILQSHYVNVGAEPIRVRDRAVMTTVPEDTVETWAAALVFTRGDFEIPPGEQGSTSFSCTPPADVNVAYLLGHMHEWGTAFSLDEVSAADETRLYEVPEWDPVYRDAPVLRDGLTEPLELKADRSYRTTCSWLNDTDEALTFPNEMCVTVAYVYPQKATIICDGDGQ
ncbi:MAG: hypothetical protein R3F59_00320 [Myxococcota bacterium]